MTARDLKDGEIEERLRQIEELIEKLELIVEGPAVIGLSMTRSGAAKRGLLEYVLSFPWQESNWSRNRAARRSVSEAVGTRERKKSCAQASCDVLEILPFS